MFLIVIFQPLDWENVLWCDWILSQNSIIGHGKKVLFVVQKILNDLSHIRAVVSQQFDLKKSYSYFKGNLLGKMYKFSAMRYLSKNLFIHQCPPFGQTTDLSLEKYSFACFLEILIWKHGHDFLLYSGVSPKWINTSVLSCCSYNSHIIWPKSGVRQRWFAAVLFRCKKDYMEMFREPIQGVRWNETEGVLAGGQNSTHALTEWNQTGEQPLT